MAAVRSWSILSAAALVGLGLSLTGKVGDRRLLLPGATSDGHHQIELACEQCHTQPFGGSDTLDVACRRCHGAELEAADDSHRKSRIDDPRDADRLARLDARRCVTCHREHWPEGTRAIGVTVPDDQCGLCHEDIRRERPSHAGLELSSCAETGCHKYHDNRSSYEEFLVEHAGEPALFSPPRAAAAGPALDGALPPGHPLSAADAGAPSEHALDSPELGAWAASAHASAGVNCSGCHDGPNGWSPSVDIEVCGHCHAPEKLGWLAGRHGMRRAVGLEPMRPELARLPMQPSAHGESLDCNSCHGAHAFDRQRARVEACQHCHADTHSQAYSGSPHARALQTELTGGTASGSGVSCATCHLPRQPQAGGRAQHDQNANLRPREKMIRSVCLDCHGLAFSIDALADPALIANNFSGPPRVHVPSIDWALARARSPHIENRGDTHDPAAPSPP